jgi:sigma-B regulation protein RsbU (phosphoserine phosphatase)
MEESMLKSAQERRRNIADALELADNLTEQLRMAGHVQRDFLPAQLPNSQRLHWATTFLPAEWVSGDIYDVARIDENHIGFYVADVVGHGIPAALLTIFFKQALVMRQTTGNSYRIFSPSEVMGNLNTKMLEQKLSRCQFVTCCYCLLNIKTLQLTYARAGHPYPILLRPHHAPRLLESKGSLLGVFEDMEFAQQTVQLAQGDKFLLYSDGSEPLIGHFDNDSGFQFSNDFLNLRNERVEKLNEEMGERGQVVQSAGGEIDDITLVGLEIL